MFFVAPYHRTREPMTENRSTLIHTVGRWVASALVAILLVGIGTVPAQAQSQGNKKQQLEELKTTYAQGVRAAKQGNHDVAYKNLERALQLAKQTEQSGAAQKINQYLTQLPKQWGNDALKNKNYEEALKHFNKGLEHNPKMAYHHYGKGLALINLDRVDESMKELTQAISLGESSGNMNVANKARERIRDHYVAEASQVLNSQNPSTAQANEAIKYLDEMEQYVDPNAKAHFYRAVALYHKGQFQQAIQSARQGLDMHDGSRSSAAKYHFVIGESQMALKNTNAACARFRQAAYGDYKPRAEHYLENQCQNTN